MELKQRIDAADIEHTGALVAGGLLLLIGLTRKGIGGTLFKFGGLALLARGAQGYAPVYRRLGLDLAQTPSGLGKFTERAQASITIDRPPRELYRMWRNLENLPVFMDHLVSVKELDDSHSHWIGQGPLGTVIQWDARIASDVEDKLISWETLEGSGVDSAGSVHFDESEGGTKVRVVLRYDPPADWLGAHIAKWLKIDPQTQITRDLRRFKEIMEAGPREKRKAPQAKVL